MITSDHKEGELSADDFVGIGQNVMSRLHNKQDIVSEFMKLNSDFELKMNDLMALNQ